MRLRRYFQGHDTYTRHKAIARLLSRFKLATILDVGGEGTLAAFMHGVNIKTANVKDSDFPIVNDALPLPDNSFDVCVSLDTIEHIDKSKRVLLLKELYRVSKRGFVLCAPFGTKEHVDFENMQLTNKNLPTESIVYLQQHIALGLPDLPEVLGYRELFQTEILYQGDFRTAGQKKYPFRVFTLLSLLIGNLIVDVKTALNLIFVREHSAYTNRFFLIVKK